MVRYGYKQNDASNKESTNCDEELGIQVDREETRAMGGNFGGNN